MQSHTHIATSWLRMALRKFKMRHGLFTETNYYCGCYCVYWGWKGEEHKILAYPRIFVASQFVPPFFRERRSGDKEGHFHDIFWGAGNPRTAGDKRAVDYRCCTKVSNSPLNTHFYNWTCLHFLPKKSAFGQYFWLMIQRFLDFPLSPAQPSGGINLCEPSLPISMLSAVHSKLQFNAKHLDRKSVV